MAAQNQLVLPEKNWPGFFKVLLDETLQQKKMKIPEKFVRDYGDDFSDEATLIAPNGHTWKLGLTRSGDGIFMERNWTAFAMYYSLADSYFLTFHYKALSTFEVHIFEPSGSEVPYPNCSPKKQKQESQAIGWASSSKEKIGGCKDNVVRNSGGKFEVGFRKASAENEPAIHHSRMFRSKKPNFRVLLAKCHASFVYLPTRFSKKYMQGTAGQTFELKLADGSGWYADIKQRANGRLTIGCGWKTFSHENKLRKGDICIFELNNNNVFKVSVIRGQQNTTT